MGLSGLESFFGGAASVTLGAVLQHGFSRLAENRAAREQERIAQDRATHKELEDLRATTQATAEGLAELRGLLIGRRSTDRPAAGDRIESDG